MSATTNALRNLSKGTYSGKGERLEWSYYDTATLAATTAPLRLFQTGLAGGRTKDKTNFPTNGSMPQGQRHDVRAFKVTYVSRTAKATADVNTLYLALNAFTIELSIAGKAPVYQKNLASVLGAPIFWTTTPTAAGDNILISSIGRFHGIDVLNISQPLAAMTPFEVVLTPWTAPGAALVADEIRVDMLGILDRLS